MELLDSDSSQQVFSSKFLNINLLFVILVDTVQLGFAVRVTFQNRKKQGTELDSGQSK